MEEGNSNKQDNSFELAFLKQRLRKEKAHKEKQRRIRKKIIKESDFVKDESTSMFDLDLSQEFSKLTVDLQGQVQADYLVAQFHKKQYIHRMKKEKQEQLKPPEADDLLPIPVTGDIMDTIVDHLNSEDVDYDYKDHFGCFVSQRFEGDEEKMVELRDTLKSCHSDLKTISKYVRKIPVIAQIFKSPFLRVELIDQFTKWRKKRKEIIRSKLTNSEKEDAVMKDLEFQKILEQESRNEASPYDQFEDGIEIPVEHHQKIKFGGILKNFMDVWEAEEIILTAILVLYWQTGNISLEKEEDNYSFVVRYVDLSIIDLVEDLNELEDKNESQELIASSKQKFIQKMVEDSREVECSWDPKIIEKLAEFVFDAVLEISQEKHKRVRNKGKYDKVDYNKMKRLGLKAFIDDILSLEELCENLVENTVLNRVVEEDMDTDQCRLTIEKEDLKMLFLAEMSEFCFDNQSQMLKDLMKDRGFQGKKNEMLRTFEEIDDFHLLIWFIANLNLSDSKYQQEKKLHKFNLEEIEEFEESLKKAQISKRSMIQPTQVIMELPDEEEESQSNSSESPQNSEKSEDNSQEDRYSKFDMVPEYIPLIQIVNHFYYSITDNIFMRQLQRKTESYEDLYQEFVFNCMKEEILFELKTLFSVIPKNTKAESIYTSRTPNLVTEKKIFFVNLAEAIPTIHRLVFDKRSTSSQSSQKKRGFSKNEFYNFEMIHFSEEFDSYLEELVEDFLRGRLPSDFEKVVVDTLLSEVYIDLVRLSDPSLLADKIKELISNAKEEIEEEAESRDPLQVKNPLDNYETLMPNEGIPEKGIPELTYVCVRKDKELERLFKSRDSCKFYLRILENMEESTVQVICKSNAQDSWNNLIPKARNIIKKMTDQGLNAEVPGQYKIVYNAKRSRYEFKDVSLKKRWRNARRFLPEFKDKKHDMMIPKKIWDKIWRFIKQAYWKVQIGIATWYALVVDGAPYENEVVRLLDECDFHKVNRRQTAIKVMGVFGEHFKLFRRELESLNQTNIPWWVFSGSDCIFGYTETLTEEHNDWQKMVLTNITSWVCKRQSENYADYPLRYDVEMCMEHFLRDFKISVTNNFIVDYEEDVHYLTEPSERLRIGKNYKKEMKKFKKERAEIYNNNKMFKFVYDEGQEPYIVLKEFFSWCKKFLKFSVDGSAFGLKIDRRELQGLEAGEDYHYEDDYNGDLDQEASKIQKKFFGVQEAEDDINKTIGMQEVDQTKIADETIAKALEAVDDTLIKTINTDITHFDTELIDNVNKSLQRRANRVRSRLIAQNNPLVGPEGNMNKKSISKTVAFALGGKSLSRIYFWAGGEPYCPQFTLHLKKEQKKIRNVANSDLVSFVKQTFLYEWMGKALQDTCKNKIYTLVHPRDKVLTIERIIKNFRSEKWAVPMDLKDFHVQFGPNNHRSLMDCLLRRSFSIRDRQIRDEIRYVLRTLKDELCRGNLFLFVKTLAEESMEDSLKQLTDEERSKIRAQFQQATKEAPANSNNHQDKQNDQPKKGRRPETTQNMFSFEVENGLMSGWKLTSLMGSIYNNSLNNYCNFWHLNKFGLIPTNYITQGDDTHFKCRFMGQALFHIGLANGIGKIAHPNKQFFSLGMTEFLKKTYDLFDQKMYYSPCRMISSILYEKENRKSKANNRNNMKDIIDVWNLFTVRIPDLERREYIKNQLYAQKCVRIKFKWHNQNYDIEDMKKLFSTPSNLNGYLLGPLAEKKLLLKQNEDSPQNIGFNLHSSYYDAYMYDYHLISEPVSNEKNWIGVSSYTNQITMRATSLSRSKGLSLNMFNNLRSNLHRMVFESINESLREYKEPTKELGELDVSKGRQYDQIFIKVIDKAFPDILQFFVDNMKFYLDGYDLATPWGQLMIMNNSLSSELDRGLRNSDSFKLNNFEIYTALSGLKQNCKFTNKIYTVLDEIMSTKTMFSFALNQNISCSICRFVQHDEYLGMFSLIINESIPLIFSRFINFEMMVDEHFKGVIVSDFDAREKRRERDEKERERCIKENKEFVRIPEENDGIITRDKIEKWFLDVLTKVIEIYLFLNYSGLWKEVRDHANLLVEVNPF